MTIPADNGPTSFDYPCTIFTQPSQSHACAQRLRSANESGEGLKEAQPESCVQPYLEVVGLLLHQLRRQVQGCTHSGSVQRQLAGYYFGHAQVSKLSDSQTTRKMSNRKARTLEGKRERGLREPCSSQSSTLCSVILETRSSTAANRSQSLLWRRGGDRASINGVWRGCGVF